MMDLRMVLAANLIVQDLYLDTLVLEEHLSQATSV